MGLVDLTGLTPTPGSVGDANQIANALNALKTGVNGIDNSNVLANAAILATKLNHPSDPQKALRGDGTWTYPATLLAWDSVDQAVSLPAALFDTGVLTVPAGAKHLRVVASGRGDAVANNIGVYLRFNNDNGANQYTYAWTLNASGTTFGTVDSTSATQLQVGNFAAASASAQMSGQLELLVANFSATTFLKRVSGTSTAQWASTAGSWQSALVSGFWNSGAAVTRVQVLVGSGNFIAGSRVSVYYVF